MADRPDSWGKFRITSVETKLRNLVSKEKRRYKDEKYDLDLTYINEKIIAMGFPSSGSEAAYRNDADDVYNFFEDRHKDHYKFYNLCSERAYPSERFHNRVSHFPFDDHNPPPLGMFLYFCRDVEEWLAQDSRNVAAIHCKAGKGRTGVMITAFLMYNKDWEQPEEAMQFYGFARTNNQKGITIPSQRTFIYYWHKILMATAEHEEGGGAGRVATMGEGGEAVKAQILAATGEHMKEGGEEDDSESDPEVAKDYDESAGAGTEAAAGGLPAAAGGGGVAADASPPPAGSGWDPSVVEQISQLEALQQAGHLSDAEFEEAKKHVFLSAGLDPNGGGGGSGGGGGGKAAAAADGEDSPDEDEEEEDDEEGGGKGGKGMSSLFKGMKFGSSKKKKGVGKVAEKACPKEGNPLMDRSWNDRNRAEKPTRGQIPPSSLKVITAVRMITTPKGGYEPLFTIASGGMTYHSKDMCPSEFFDKQDVINIPVPDLPVIDEVFVTFYKPGTFGKKKKMLQFWFHCSFVDGDRCVMAKKDMDKAIKDKKHKKYSADFKIELVLKDVAEGGEVEDPRREFVPKKCDMK